MRSPDDAMGAPSSGSQCARERREDCERLHQEIDHVADDEQLDRPHLRLPPAGEKVAGEKPGPRDERSEGREDAAIDVRERLECLLGEVLQRVVVMTSRFAARGAYRPDRSAPHATQRDAGAMGHTISSWRDRSIPLPWQRSNAR